MEPPRPATLVDLLASLARVPEERGLLLVSPSFEERHVSWAQLHRLMLFQAENLLAQGVRPGQAVVVPMTTDLAFITAFMALVWIGAVPASVGGQMAGQAREAYLSRLARLRQQQGLERIILDPRLRAQALHQGRLETSTLVELLPFDAEPAGESPSVAPHVATVRDIAFVQYSSGSTSEPKGVAILHENICRNLQLICAHDGRSAESRVVMWVPLYHDMGLVGGLLSPMLHANRLVLLHPVCFVMRPISWHQYLSAQRGTISACPNFALDMCVTRIRDRHLLEAPLDLSSVELVWNGAEPVRASSIERFEERFAPSGFRRGVIQPAYGMAEASLAVTARPLGSPVVASEADGVSVVSVGRPLGDFRIRIVDSSGRDLPCGQIGEILVQGASVAAGYYRDVEQTERWFDSGWLHAGDLGFLDEEGELHVTGRVKDLIIVNGRNFYAHDVAARLDELPFVSPGQHHVFGVESEDGERVVVMTVLDRAVTGEGVGRVRRFLEEGEGSWVRGELGAAASRYLDDANPSEIDALVEQIRAFVLDELGLPVHDVMVVRKVPRTASGKVRRDECERLYREHLAARGDVA